MEIIIDGITFDVMADVQRTADVLPSDISGMLLDGSYFNDVIGTYYSYDVTLKYPLYNQGKYFNLYEMFTQPVDGHTFVLPYNNETIQLTARVETVTDRWIETDSKFTFWEAFRATIISNAPSKSMSLQQVISRGLTPLPDAQSPNVGDTYTFTANGWEATGEMTDADTTAY